MLGNPTGQRAALQAYLSAYYYAGQLANPTTLLLFPTVATTGANEDESAAVTLHFLSRHGGYAAWRLTSAAIGFNYWTQSTTGNTQPAWASMPVTAWDGTTTPTATVRWRDAAGVAKTATATWPVMASGLCFLSEGLPGCNPRVASLRAERVITCERYPAGVTDPNPWLWLLRNTLTEGVVWGTRGVPTSPDGLSDYVAQSWGVTDRWQR